MDNRADITNKRTETGGGHSYICQIAQHWEVTGSGKFDTIVTNNFRKRIHEKFCLSRSKQSTTATTSNQK